MTERIARRRAAAASRSKKPQERKPLASYGLCSCGFFCASCRPASPADARCVRLSARSAGSAFAVVVSIAA